MTEEDTTSSQTPPKKTGKKRTTPLDREKRRAKVLQFMEGGITARRTIGELLGVSCSTVQEDINFLLKELREQNLVSFADQTALALQRLEVAITAIWPKVLKGDYEAIDRLLLIMKRESDTTGMDGFKRDRQDLADKAGRYHPNDKQLPNMVDNSINVNLGSGDELGDIFAHIRNLPPDQALTYLANMKAILENTPSNDAND